MISDPIDILSQFPIRKTKQQKSGFRDAVVDHGKNRGYAVRVEEGKYGVRNIVIGDPDNAKYLITAHYDTPASIGLPNLIAPNNPIIFILIQVWLVGILVLSAVAVGLFAYWLGAAKTIALIFGYVSYMLLLLLMLRGPANRNNANDNTSGVVTLMEILSAIPEELRRKVCFVLFDLEESGLLGSAAYRNLHRQATEKQLVLNLDCVGDGDVIQLTPVRNARNDQTVLDELSAICGDYGDKELRLRSKGFYHGSSDHKKFPKGVAVMALRYHKGVGFYCGRIHTWRDTVLDRRNVAVLRDALITLISNDKQLQNNNQEDET